MNRDDLLHSLKDLLAECCSADQKKRVQDLSKGRVTDELFYSCGYTLDDEQLEQAKIEVGHLMRNHLDLPEIIKRLALTHQLITARQLACINARPTSVNNYCDRSTFWLAPEILLQQRKFWKRRLLRKKLPSF